MVITELVEAHAFVIQNQVLVFLLYQDCLLSKAKILRLFWFFWGGGCLGGLIYLLNVHCAFTIN